MKHLEAFSMGKKFGHPELNEDSFVVIPDAGYAVIDGVTDRNGTRYGGMLSGQFASRTVKRATELYILAQTDPKAPEAMRYAGPASFVRYLTDVLRQAYVDEGAYEAARDDWKVRGGCTVMAALQVGDKLEVVAVGDSGIRVNGNDVLQVLKPLDDVTGLLRRETWNLFKAAGYAPDFCDMQAAAITWRGTKNQEPGAPTADPALLVEIEKRALAACHAHLPDVPEAEFIELIEHGIMHGQGNFQNAGERALGYGGLDGFPVLDKYIDARTYRMADIETLELFSDGYFKIAEGFGVAAWEAAFREVEAIDPHKIGPYLSTKGTTDTALTDDRTYVGIALR
ncbi:hypothetical protein GCM10011321_16080 [Youhaiella tibetensis]|uniref:Uncharacterized protein n=1 Tax=Paradevosia tibetensis TaxID=1447062 RepID=A0A5B9DMS6_9HYPH|nr:protein phosphatase 2C domain-containing protein [Youhaiella tibetensis]QEE20292.1 hypothetical protein FNA67_08950 [Youhaiella tibetensis]GGF25402.1 hypothetical protein GCM10011321_16080 [Youhaiella tibetensis]